MTLAIHHNASSMMITSPLPIRGARLRMLESFLSISLTFQSSLLSLSQWQRGVRTATAMDNHGPQLCFSELINCTKPCVGELVGIPPLLLDVRPSKPETEVVSLNPHLKLYCALHDTTDRGQGVPCPYRLLSSSRRTNDATPLEPLSDHDKDSG